MTESDLRQARHALRGRMNALKLCVSAFDVVETPQETLEFLDLIEQAADRTLEALDGLEKVLGDMSPPP